MMTSIHRAACAALLCTALGWGAPASAQQDRSGWPEPVHDDIRLGKLMIDRLEHAWGEDEDTLNWEVQGWYGGDYDRVWLEGEGEEVTDGGRGGEIERLDLLYGRLIAPFWDLRAGFGYQAEYGPGPDPDRGFAVVGVSGLAPQWFETDANLRLSEDGDLSVDLELEYDLLLTQRLVLQPRLETAYAFDDVPRFGIGRGPTDVKLGLRLRYGVVRELAPYVGVEWQRLLADTADLAEAGGEDVRHTSVVVGIRAWF